MSKLLINKKSREVISGVTVKSVKTNIGHDLAGANCQVYLDNKKIATYDNDGLGGECTFHKPGENFGYLAPQSLVDYLNKHNFKQLMLDNGWYMEGLLESVDQITDHEMAVCAVEEAINKELSDRQYRRLQKKSILFGKPYTENVRYVQFKHPLAEIAKSQKGLNTIKKYLDEKIAGLGEGEEILNTNLSEIGIELKETA